jgi:hypothetical protein
MRLAAADRASQERLEQSAAGGDARAAGEAVALIGTQRGAAVRASPCLLDVHGQAV